MARYNLVQHLREAWPKWKEQAKEANKLFRSYCAINIGGVPGLATEHRLALRIDLGRTVEEAAAREYLYRWNLALRSSSFGVPHSLGLDGV